NRGPPGRCVAREVDGAELDGALALAGDQPGRARRRSAPGGAAVGRRAELIAGDAGQAVRAARAVEGDAADALPGQAAAGHRGHARRGAVEADDAAGRGAGGGPAGGVAGGVGGTELDEG